MPVSCVVMVSQSTTLPFRSFLRAFDTGETLVANIYNPMNSSISAWHGHQLVHTMHVSWLPDFMAYLSPQKCQVLSGEPPGPDSACSVIQSNPQAFLIPTPSHATLNLAGTLMSISVNSNVSSCKAETALSNEMPVWSSLWGTYSSHSMCNGLSLSKGLLQLPSLSCEDWNKQQNHNSMMCSH